LILPFIEQSTMYNALAPDITTPGGPAAVNALYQTPIPVYQCPSDAGPLTNSNFGNYGKINYVVNKWVTGPDANSNPAPMKIQTIRDGSSNTLLVGERDLTVNIAGSAFIRHNATTASFEGRIGRGLNPQPAPGATFNTGSEQRLAYNSLHTGGCNFAFADGSVHFLSNTLDCDPNDAYTNFPGVNSTNFNGQRLELPNDGLPLSFTDF